MVIIINNNMIQDIAFDIAENYNPNLWVDGSNLGYGFQSWDFDLIQGGGFAGTFIGNPADAGISGLGSNSFAFALYANPYGSGASVSVTRPFSATMEVGDVFTIDFGLNWDSNFADSFRGFELYNNNTPVLEVYGSNNDNIYLNNNNNFDNVMFDIYGTNAMRLFFKLVDSTTMNVSGIGRNGSEVFNQNVSVASAPNKISFYFEETNSDTNRQMYFDRLNIFKYVVEPTPTPSPTPTPTPSIPSNPIEERNAKYATATESGEKRFRRLFGLGYV